VFISDAWNLLPQVISNDDSYSMNHMIVGSGSIYSEGKGLNKLVPTKIKAIIDNVKIVLHIKLCIQD
jgi:hypothetical protein